MSEYALRQRQLRNAAQTVQKLQSEEDAQDFYYCPDCTSGRSDYPPKGCGVCRDGTKLAFIRAGATLAEVERAFGVDVVSERNEDTSPSPSSIPATAGRNIDDTQTACDDGTCGLCRTCAPAGLPTLEEVLDFMEISGVVRVSVSGKDITRAEVCRAIESWARLAVEAQQDAERLDWLEKQDAADIGAWAWVQADGKQGWTICDRTSIGEPRWTGDGPTLRAAIDAARASRPTGGTE